MNEISINQWLDRYQREGIEGLKTKPGRGQSEQRFRNLADNMTQLAWMADEQGWIIN
jgi:transposase